MAKNNSLQKKKSGGVLGWIERVGNKIPHPFILFLVLMIIIAVITFFAKGATVVNPSTDEAVSIKSIISGEGLVFALTSMVKNFTGFAPLGLVLSMTLGIGLAEEVGLMSAFMRRTILGVSAKFVVPVIMLIGICGNLASDAAIVIVPTLSGIIFLYLGRNPIAGVALGYAATTAGFTANLMIAGTDALLQGITNQASDIINGPHIEVTANWFFMIASTFVITIAGTLINNYVVEPRVGPYEGTVVVEKSEVSDEEKRGLKYALIALLVYIAIIVALCVPATSPLRNPETGSLTTQAPLMKGIIPIILLMFISVSIAYGKGAGVIKKASVEVPNIMTKSIAKMSGFIVLAFIIGQFIAWFNWTNTGEYLAIVLAEALKNAGFTGIPLFIFYILIVAFINIFIGSGSAKWALLAPVFVPMMYLLGYHPAWTQLLYRLGDSVTNIITPLFPYFPIILAFMQEYDEEAGAGTLLSTMIPYAGILLFVWIVFMIIWYLFVPIPIGIGGQILI
ncbi:MAG: AbgT family transporter [Tissierellia bacterium]|nr:AbgT family transporter [Tissierellia bacterium]